MSKVVVRGPSLTEIAETVTTEVRHQMESRSYRAANELRNSALIVLRGQRSGRRYKIPGTHRLQMDKSTGKKRHGRYYTASAPGEPPAVRTGNFRLSWKPEAHVVMGSYISRITSDIRTENGRYILGELLEEGTPKMEPRPHHDRIREHAEPKIFRIYDEPYFNE